MQTALIFFPLKILLALGQLGRIFNQHPKLYVSGQSLDCLSLWTDLTTHVSSTQCKSGHWREKDVCISGALRVLEKPHDITLMYIVHPKKGHANKDSGQ